MAIQINDIPGLGTRYFPDGTSDEEIKATIDGERQFGAKEPAWLEKAAISVGGGLTEAGQGVKQRYLGAQEALGFAPPGTENTYRQQNLDDKQQYLQGVTPLKTEEPIGMTMGGRLGGLFGESLPYLPLAAGGLLASVGAGALQGALAPLKPDESVAASTFGGSLGGAAGHYIAPYLSAPLNKAVNAYKGVLGEGVDKGLVDSGLTFASDVSSSPTLNNLGRYLEKIPGAGMVKARAEQNVKAQGRMDAYLGGLEKELSSQYGGKTGLKKLQMAANGALGEGRQGKAQSLLSRIEADGDWKTITETSADVNLFRKQLIADKMFGRVDNLAGTNLADASNTSLAAQNLAEILDKKILPNDPLRSTATTIKEKLNNILGGKPQRDPATGRQVFQAPKATFSQLKELRTDVSTMLSNKYRTAAIGDNESALLQRLKKSIDADMDNFASQMGREFKGEYKRANDFYRNNLVPYKMGKLARAINSDNPEELFKQFITRSRDDYDFNPTLLYKALDDKGKAAIRYGIVRQSFDRTMDSQTGIFDSGAFARDLKNRVSGINVFFNGQEKAQLEGVAKLMRSVERSAQAQKIPDTGAMNTPIQLAKTVGAGLVGAAAATSSAGFLALALTGMGGANALRWMMTNPSAQKLLLASSKTPFESKSMQTIMNSLGTLMKKAAISSTAESVRK